LRPHPGPARQALVSQPLVRPIIDLDDAGDATVTVTDVGFVDAPPGAAFAIGTPNGFELHPVLHLTCP
jgi:hypothetical protein